MPSNWLPYFQVTSVDESIATVNANGGQVHFGPMDIPGTGRFAVRTMTASKSLSNQWLIAPAPPAESAPPKQVRATRPIEGDPATYIVVIVVNRSSVWTRGFIMSK